MERERTKEREREREWQIEPYTHIDPPYWNFHGGHQSSSCQETDSSTGVDSGWWCLKCVHMKINFHFRLKSRVIIFFTKSAIFRLKIIYGVILLKIWFKYWWNLLFCIKIFSSLRKVLRYFISITSTLDIELKFKIILRKLPSGVVLFIRSTIAIEAKSEMKMFHVFSNCSGLWFSIISSFWIFYSYLFPRMLVGNMGLNWMFKTSSIIII